MEQVIPQAVMIYDRVTINDPKTTESNRSEVSFFRDPIGTMSKTQADTNMRTGSEIRVPFMVDGIILHSQDKRLWDDAWFSLDTNDRPIVQFGTKAGRLSGLATTVDVARRRAVIFPNEPSRARLNWPMVMAIPNGTVITVIVTGRAFNNDGSSFDRNYPPQQDIFAWVTAGDELPEWFRPEAFEKITEPAVNNDHEVAAVAGGIKAKPEVRKESIVQRLTRLLTPQNNIKAGGIK